MGLPIKMVAAVTPNDIVHRTLQVHSLTSMLFGFADKVMAIGISIIVIETSISKTGDFSLSPEVLQTWATAMDIQVISSQVPQPTC